MKKRSPIWLLPKEKMKDLVSESNSWAEVLSHLGLKDVGSARTKQKKYGVCVACAQVLSRTMMRPPYQKLLMQIKKWGFSKTGRFYGVSDNAIRKWKRYYELENHREEK
jgi:hypothetical protein